MKLLLIVLLVPVLCRAQGDYRGFRLPEIYNPSHYDLHLTVPDEVFNGTSRNFSGVVSITFTVTEPVTEINLHAVILNHNESVITVTSTDTNEAPISVTDQVYNDTNHIWAIYLDATLKINTEYVVTIDYVAEMSDTTMKGFYLSSYVNKAGQKRYLGTTQFESTSAREAFPCFDEPRYKATYDIRITHPKEQNAICNTPVKVLDETDAASTTTIFETTPKISTYLIAFVVSDFTCTGTVNITNEIPHSLCSSPDTANQRDLTNTHSPPIMAALESITGINYSEHQFGKMEQVAVPDFSAGAMENWGLVTYREAYILYDPDETPETSKKSLITVVAHEFTHQWFGNWVTMDWWDHIFLNEGFARLYQYFSVHLVKEFENWQLDKQFIGDQMHTVFIVDGSNTSDAITSLAASPDEISAKFGNINYNKAACIIRMVWNMMGTDNFQAAIRSYLQAKAFANAVASDLVSAWNDNLPNDLLPTGVTDFATIMDSWLNKAGYPVITATLDGRDVTLSQQRFLYNNETDETKWYVPITYTLSSDRTTFDQYTPKNWLLPDEDLKLTNVLPEGADSWILFNNQQSSYYRLDYDNALWQRIKNALETNLSSIDVLNRAQIVDDLFTYARTGRKTYAEVLNLLAYLEKETAHFPWVAANTGLNYIISRLSSENAIYEKMVALNLKLLSAVKETVTFDAPEDESNQVNIFKRTLVLNALCRLGDASSIQKTVELYQDHRVNGAKLDKNIKSVVYCNALKHSTTPTEDYNFLWNKYQTTNVATEKVLILQALGCVKDTTLLKQFLDNAFSADSGIRLQDLSTAVSSIYNTPEGTEYALDYVIENHERMTGFYSPGTMVSGVASRLTTQTQIDNFEKKIASLPDNLKASAERALVSARNNLNWASEREEDLKSYFGDDTTEPSTPENVTDPENPGNVTDPDDGGNTTPGAAVPSAVLSSLVMLLAVLIHSYIR